ncbi:DUF3883 domain-containing protein [Desulfosporosinus sp. SYSU MS00001]|uniref:DUF3883 domain-containing protein n=1 Tax=Desulfosporosinus sp. SYSU MS00001 TaxID=3416284 RepID=UPI003CEB443F
MARQKLDTKEMLSVLTEQTQKVVSNFLQYYKPISHAQYISAISNLFYVLGKDDVALLDINDLREIQEFLKIRENKGSNDKYSESFFKYIYAFNIIKNPAGFEKIWIKEKLISHFNGLSKKTNEVEKEYSPALTLEEITNIQQLMDLDYQDNMKMLKISFCWYLIFQTDCTVNEIIKMVAGDYDYNSHTIKSHIGKEYYVPDKYIVLFDYLKDRTFSGFNTVNEYITELSTIMGMKKITPQMIKIARKENMIRCSLCGINYTNIKENWVSINNRIVCVNCGENLKKNTNITIETFENQNISDEQITENLEIAPIIYTFDELKKKLNKKVDYLNLHKFLMEIGNLGEAFVYDLEKRKLAGTKYEEYVSNLPARDHTNGYDIFSYDLDGTELYIEVKTETKEDSAFYLSDNELKTAQRLKSERKKYLIYRVHNILAENKSDITYEIIQDITNNNDYKFDVCTWKVSRNSKL